MNKKHLDAIWQNVESELNHTQLTKSLSRFFYKNPLFTTLLLLAFFALASLIIIKLFHLEVWFFDCFSPFF